MLLEQEIQNRLKLLTIKIQQLITEERLLPINNLTL
jgi:hypothetical protein